MLIKSNNLLQLVTSTPGHIEELKVLEMSLNKEGFLSKSFLLLTLLVDKSKIVIVQLGKMHLILPFTITKVEVRMRNVLINQRKKMLSISKFIQFFTEILEVQNNNDAENQLRATEK